MGRKTQRLDGFELAELMMTPKQRQMVEMIHQELPEAMNAARSYLLGGGDPTWKCPQCGHRVPEYRPQCNKCWANRPPVEPFIETTARKVPETGALEDLRKIDEILEQANKKEE